MICLIIDFDSATLYICISAVFFENAIRRVGKGREGNRRKEKRREERIE